MNLLNRFSVLVLAGVVLAGAAACADRSVAGPEADAAVVAVPRASAQPKASDRACWGQASRVFAQMGLMGEHSSQFGGPRLGLRNLARSLYEAGIIEEDTMQALGKFVADELGLTIEACL